MQYREFTKDKLKISQLGFGCMRFPVIDGDNARIDEEVAFEMLRYAFDHGVNYFDTAYAYHDGNSEPFVGEALEKIGREKVFLATKLPMWLCKTPEDYPRIFSEQLEKLRTDYVDFYLCHALNKKTFHKMKENDVFSFLDEEKEKGRLRYAGFSFHDDLSVFKEIIDSYDWDFCQIQYNYVDEHYQAGLEGLLYAKSKGIDVIIMEPVKGGKLAKCPPELEEIFSRSQHSYTPAEWALRWVFNDPNVGIVLSGMSSMDQTRENIQIASEAAPLAFTDADAQTVKDARSFYEARVQVGCTSCEYCLPCPAKVSIPNIFEMYNNSYIYDCRENYVGDYAQLVAKGRSAQSCVECGHCESVCPQHLSVIQDLKNADAFLVDFK